VGLALVDTLAGETRSLKRSLPTLDSAQTHDVGAPLYLTIELKTLTNFFYLRLVFYLDD
jgi:hypothetical protein